MMKAIWGQLLTPLRLMDTSQTNGVSAPKACRARSQFQKDYDRVIFSPAFRRLARKTQVHPLNTNDHVHTRLIHSLEVACVGRSLGVSAGDLLHNHGLLPETVTAEDVGMIVQAACLAHDIGNPPFGHTGEDAVRDWFMNPNHWEYLQPLPEAGQVADFQRYEGNAQGFRLVCRLEKHFGCGGLRLTYPTLGAMLKYPWLSDQRGGRSKFGCFYAEQDLLGQVAQTLGLAHSAAGGFRRHPLVYLVEAADDICYRVLDLEDAVELNILPYTHYAEIVAPLVSRDRLLEAAEVRSVKDRLALLRGPLFDRLVSYGVKIFDEQLTDITLEDIDKPLLSFYPDSEERIFLNAAKGVAESLIFRDRPKTEIEVGVYATLGSLLSVFISAAYEWHAEPRGRVSRRCQCINDLLGSQGFDAQDDLYTSYMKVMDFLSGMTDVHATRLSRRLSGILQ